MINRRKGVGVVLAAKYLDNILSIKKVSETACRHGDLEYVGAYAPQTGCNDTEKESFWTDFSALIQSILEDEQLEIGADLNGPGLGKMERNSAMMEKIWIESVHANNQLSYIAKEIDQSCEAPCHCRHAQTWFPSQSSYRSSRIVRAIRRITRSERKFFMNLYYSRFSEMYSFK